MTKNKGFSRPPKPASAEEFIGGAPSMKIEAKVQVSTSDQDHRKQKIVVLPTSLLADLKRKATESTLTGDGKRVTESDIVEAALREYLAK